MDGHAGSIMNYIVVRRASEWKKRGGIAFQAGGRVAFNSQETRKPGFPALELLLATAKKKDA